MDKKDKLEKNQGNIKNQEAVLKSLKQQQAEESGKIVEVANSK
jgi:hypothetical protein